MSCDLLAELALDTKHESPLAVVTHTWRKRSEGLRSEPNRVRRRGMEHLGLGNIHTRRQLKSVLLNAPLHRVTQKNATMLFTHFAN